MIAPSVKAHQFGSQLPDPISLNDPEAGWDVPALAANESCRVISLFAPAPDLDVDAFLQSAYGQERFYWSEPGPVESRLTMAGIGIAAEIRTAPVLDSEVESASPGNRFTEIADAARQLFRGLLVHPAESTPDASLLTGLPDHPARPRLFGGFAFQDDFVPDNTWSVFYPAQFVLPHFQWVRVGKEAFLTINALIPSDEEPSESLDGLREALAARLALPSRSQQHTITPHDIHYPMSADMWRNIVRNATQAIAEAHLEKVVLSRVCEVRTKELIDAAATLEFLNSHYRDSYRFIFEPVPHHAFFGATPELLIQKTGNSVSTMALAGSAARGQTSEQDEQLASQLLASRKDRHEHQLVADTIHRKLAGLLAEVHIPSEPRMLKLRNIQHLLTPIEGRLRNPELGILPLVNLLHPTPAMGGVPSAAALAFLRRAELVPRGWYAAPIGWLDACGDGVFAVAIRSAVTQHTRAWLYAGAGIVNDSEPEREWVETSLKFRPMLGALGVEETIR
jgi:menaquinone-specific isochorismate synthase